MHNNTYEKVFRARRKGRSMGYAIDGSAKRGINRQSKKSSRFRAMYRMWNLREHVSTISNQTKNRWNKRGVARAFAVEFPLFVSQLIDGSEVYES